MKELLKANQTKTGDYLILVRWHNHGLYHTVDGLKRDDEYIVAYTWNPSSIEADGWGHGHYFTNLESAEIYFNKKWEEEK